MKWDVYDRKEEISKYAYSKHAYRYIRDIDVQLIPLMLVTLYSKSCPKLCTWAVLYSVKCVNVGMVRVNFCEGSVTRTFAGTDLDDFVLNYTNCLTALY